MGTVLVVERNGKLQLVINSLLDDASTKTYINSDVAFDLAMQGEVRNVTVNVLNGQENVSQTMPEEFQLSSVKGGQVLQYRPSRLVESPEIYAQGLEKASSEMETSERDTLPNLALVPLSICWLE